MKSKNWKGHKKLMKELYCNHALDSELLIHEAASFFFYNRYGFGQKVDAAL
jgi:hypothetical protein